VSETARFFLLQTVLLSVVLILHTYIGLHIIRRTLIFSDLVLDQLAALGALVGIGLGLEYGSPGGYLFALGAVLVGAFLLAVIKPSSRAIPREAVIGILYAMALVASLLVGDKLSGGSVYVTKTLAGALLWVSWPLVAVTAGVYVILLVFHFRYREKFVHLAENRLAPEEEKRWDFLLFATQGIITVLIVPIAGVLLAYAFLMIPAATASLFRRDWLGAVALGWSLGLAACLAGLGASYRWNFPYGPTLILALGALFIGALLARGLFGRTKNVRIP